MSFARRFRLGIAVCLCFTAPALIDARVLAEEGPRFAEDAPREAARRGGDLERSRKWLKAIEHYEAALRKWPEDKELKYGLRRSRIHFSIARRYADRSFEERLIAKTRYDALQLLEAVLKQVRATYVDPISSTSFVAHGTESFYLALGNDRFLKKNLPNADAYAVRQMRRILRERYWNKPIADRSNARQVVGQVCDAAWSLLKLPAGPVVMEYVFGGCNALDDYSSFLTPNRLDDLYGNIDGEFVGLGIEMKGETGKGMLLMNVLAAGPAEEGGLRRGEFITGIDGVDCRNMSTDEAAKLLRGKAGSRVRLRIATSSGGPERERTFARRAVQIKSIPVAKIVDRENGVGYIQMTGFQKTSATELDDALWKLRRDGMRSLIWDLRGNPGGLLTAAVEVLDRFVEDGVLVSTKGRTRDQNWSYSAHRSGTWKLPLVLLVDGDSASASEIVAGAVLDHRRGTIVGRKTFGKWSVQSIFPVRDSTGLRLTTAKFYSPAGRTLGKVGVKPHVVVKQEESRTVGYRPATPNVDRDADLRKGLEILQQKTAQR